MGARSSEAVRRLAWTGLALGLVSACATTHRAPPSPGVARSEVLDAEHRWWRAVSRGDVDHALSRISEQTVFEAPDGSLVHGRVAMGERLRRDLGDRIEVLGIPEHVHLDSPDLVVVTGSGQWSGLAPDGRGVTTVRYLDTWRWTGSAWRLVSAAASPVAESSPGLAVVRRALAAWSSGDWAALEPLLAPGYHARSDGGADGGELRRRYEAFHHAWAQARFDIDEQFVVGERIVTRLTATLSEAGTGRTARYAGLDISRVVDGQLTEHWDSWEPLPAEPSPASSPTAAPGATPDRAAAD